MVPDFVPAMGSIEFQVMRNEFQIYFASRVIKILMLMLIFYYNKQVYFWF